MNRFLFIDNYLYMTIDSIIEYSAYTNIMLGENNTLQLEVR